MKVAIVHDWLVSNGGAENCLEVFCELFPGADVYTLIYNPAAIRSEKIKRMKIRTSFIQNLPCGRKFYRHYLPLMPYAVESFNLEGYDFILSSSHCVAKGARAQKGARHLCYCYTPMRYVWEMYGAYFDKRQTRLLASLAMPFFANHLRKWDVASSKRVHKFVAISETVRARIKEHYETDADVLFPPVDTGFFGNTGEKREDFFLVVSRFVPYKRIGLAVAAFNRLGLPLVVIGGGPGEKELRKMAGKNTRILTEQSGESIRSHYSRCRALVFCGLEDFGIVPLEAQACGAPVIAFGQGGLKETVVEGKTGVFFAEQTETALAETVKKFSLMKFSEKDAVDNALKYSRDKFKAGFKEYAENFIKMKGE